MIQKVALLIIILFIVPIGFSYTRSMGGVEAIPDSYALYTELGLAGIVNFAAFEEAVEGYYKISKRKELLTLIDFSKPSTKERLFVIDMRKHAIEFVSHVAHGKNSGELFATSFSNTNGSNKSSLGFYLTGATYDGRNGYSLRLNGLEEGINDKAMERAIVIHGADYANPTPSMGRLGRSLGCPALPKALNAPIIDAIKGGSVLFIYADSPEYRAQTKIVPTAAPHTRFVAST